MYVKTSEAVVLLNKNLADLAWLIKYFVISNNKSSKTNLKVDPLLIDMTIWNQIGIYYH